MSEPLKAANPSEIEALKADAIAEGKILLQDTKDFLTEIITAAGGFAAGEVQKVEPAVVDLALSLIPVGPLHDIIMSFVKPLADQASQALDAQAKALIGQAIARLEAIIASIPV